MTRALRRSGRSTEARPALCLALVYAAEQVAGCGAGGDGGHADGVAAAPKLSSRHRR